MSFTKNSPCCKIPDDLEDLYIPLVIVEGFLGLGDLVWGNFEHYLNIDCRMSRKPQRQVLFPHIGPVSSLHDKACELFAALKGGQVDYGEEHSKVHGHARFGRIIEKGLYPTWSPASPLHFLGHSIGGCTVVKLQHLLKQGHFGPDYHPDMVYSVNSICAPFRGTQVVYSLGISHHNAPSVRPFSIGSTLLTKAVHLVAYFSPVLPKMFDLHAESRSLSFKDSSLFTFVRNLLWRSDWAESRDAAPFDVTFQAADERESMGEGAVHHKTYYRSYAAFHTTRINEAQNTHTPPLTRLLTPLLYLSSHVMGVFDFTSLRPVPSFLVEDPIGEDSPTLGEEYWANDGIVPLFSQWHPLPCKDKHCNHLGSPHTCEESGILDTTPGVWHVIEADETHHLSVAPFWTSSRQQRLFWQRMGDWLRAIESK